MYSLTIELKDSKWFVNDKPFSEMNETEKEILIKFIKQHDSI